MGRDKPGSGESLADESIELDHRGAHHQLESLRRVSEGLRGLRYRGDSSGHVSVEFLQRRQQLLIVQNRQAPEFRHHERDVREQSRMADAQDRLDPADGLERARCAGKALAHRGKSLWDILGTHGEFVGCIRLIIRRRSFHRDGVGQRTRDLLGYAHQHSRGIFPNRSDVRVE